MSNRSVSILIEKEKVLLIHRQKEGCEYYVLPRGSLEEGETPEAACIREAKEETSLQVEIQRKVVVLENGPRKEHYFLVKYCSGQVKLGGPEKERNSLQDTYTPIWIDIADLSTIELLPEAVLPIVRSLQKDSVEKSSINESA